jgi:hypothetical protein
MLAIGRALMHGPESPAARRAFDGPRPKARP